jgi:hypothetical protein
MSFESSWEFNSPPWTALDEDIWDNLSSELEHETALSSEEQLQPRSNHASTDLDIASKPNSNEDNNSSIIEDTPRRELTTLRGLTIPDHDVGRRLLNSPGAD